MGACRPCERIHYIISGAAIHYADHENGRRRIISFHGAGTVFPGYHREVFRIERTLMTTALSDMEVLEFTLEQFQAMLLENRSLGEQVIEWYAAYVNRFLFESIHQEYNSSLVKISNLLYLLTLHPPQGSGQAIRITQDALAELLGLSRVQLTRGLSELRRRRIISTARGSICIEDRAALAELCSSETV